MITYAQSIQKDTAAIQISTLKPALFQAMKDELAHGRSRAAAGITLPHQIYEGSEYRVNTARRDSLYVEPTAHTSLQAELSRIARAYMSESFNMKSSDVIEMMTHETLVYPVGNGLVLHRDDNPESIRNCYATTIILYMNDDFVGGTLEFPQHEVIIEPKPGMIVVFPCNGNFLHRVTPITCGIRFSHQCRYMIMNGSTGSLVV